MDFKQLVMRHVKLAGQVESAGKLNFMQKAAAAERAVKEQCELNGQLVEAVIYLEQKLNKIALANGVGGCDG